MKLSREKRRGAKSNFDEERDSGELCGTTRIHAATAEEVDVRLKPWRELVGLDFLPISGAEIDDAVRLIDPETCAEGAPSAITAGARPRFWNKITPSQMKAALVAAMLAHEGLNRMSKLQESNSFNLPAGDLLIKVLQSSSFDADTKGFAVLLMLRQPVGTRAVEALRSINADPNKSTFLAASLGVASRKLNNALRVAPA